MYAQCTGIRKGLQFPATQQGQEFIKNVFKKQNEVVIKQGGSTFTFSAKGFTKALQNLDKSSGGI